MGARERTGERAHRVPSTSLPSLKLIEKRLKRAGVWKEFCSLVRARCDRDFLLIAFAAIPRYAERDTWNSLFGFKRRSLSTALRVLENCANVLCKLNASQAGSRFAKARPGIEWHRIPALLRSYSEYLKRLSSRQGGFNVQNKPNFNDARARITRYVVESTSKHHDRELGHILSVLTGRNITAEAQKVWRKKHAGLLSTVDRSLLM